MTGSMRASPAAMLRTAESGGTGAFAGATGTIKAKNLNKAGTRTAVTITYSG